MKGKKPAQMIIRTENDSREPIIAIVDSTGLTTTTKGACIEDKYRGQVEEGEEKVSEAAYFS